jgi:hypothetical protein
VCFFESDARASQQHFVSIMTFRFIPLLAFALLCLCPLALTCSTLAAGRLATSDGSVIISQTTDGDGNDDARIVRDQHLPSSYFCNSFTMFVFLLPIGRPTAAARSSPTTLSVSPATLERTAARHCALPPPRLPRRVSFNT